MLDYNFRSKCHLAPIKVGRKKIKKTGQVVQVWVCCTCHASNVAIVPKEEALSQKKLLESGKITPKEVMDE